MTCPTCSRPNRDFVNSSGLLTRCDDPWHIGRDFLAETLATTPLPRHWLAGLVDDATHRPESLSSRGPAPEAASPARPDDFATQTPPAPHFPPPSHHGAPERAYDASKDSHFPYTTPVPEPTTNGANGWIYCNACDAPRPTSGHECAPIVGIDGTRACAPGGACWFTGDLFNLSERAAFAEDLVNRLAFIHGCQCVQYARDYESGRDHEFIYCDDSGKCLFCDAARGGGR